MKEEEKIELSFDGLNISKELLFVLTKNKFVKPTPIQHQVIPIALSGKDVVGIAQTGTGKTLAFGIPMLQRLLSSTKSQGLVLLPTRELAIQVEEVIAKLGSSFRLKTAVLIGGASINAQISALRRNPAIIIATPGRLADHLKQRTLTLKNVSTIVLDEADRMFDVGFAPQIKAIMDQAPEERQTLLFSATMPQEIIEMANKYMTSPLRIEIAPAGTSAEFVEQEVIIVAKEAKTQLLDKILEENKETVLVFVRTRHSAKRIAKEVNAMGHTAAEIHSDRSLFQRKEALAGFKSGKYRILIATDIAARGIDVKDISLVINYDLPDDLSDYVHRIGRTGRNGSSGRAVSFITRQERFSVKRIERIIRKEIKISETPILPDRRPSVIERNDDAIDFRRREQGNRSPRGGFGGGSRGGFSGGFGREPRNSFDRKPSFKSRENEGFQEREEGDFSDRSDRFTRKEKDELKPTFKKREGAGFAKDFKKKKPTTTFKPSPFKKRQDGDSDGEYRGRSSRGTNDAGKSKFNGKRGRSNAQKKFR